MSVMGGSIMPEALRQGRMEQKGPRSFLRRTNVPLCDPVQLRSTRRGKVKLDASVPTEASELSLELRPAVGVESLHAHTSLPLYQLDDVDHGLRDIAPWTADE